MHCCFGIFYSSILSADLGWLDWPLDWVIEALRDCLFYSIPFILFFFHSIEFEGSSLPLIDWLIYLFSLGGHHQSFPASRLSHPSERRHSEHRRFGAGVSRWAESHVFHEYGRGRSDSRRCRGNCRCVCGQNGFIHYRNGCGRHDYPAGGTVGPFLWIILRFTVGLKGSSLHWLIDRLIKEFFSCWWYWSIDCLIAWNWNHFFLVKDEFRR